MVILFFIGHLFGEEAYKFATFAAYIPETIDRMDRNDGIGQFSWHNWCEPTTFDGLFYLLRVSHLCDCIAMAFKFPDCMFHIRPMCLDGR